MVNIPMAGAPTSSRRSVVQGRMPPSLVRHRHQPGESLLYVGACLGLLLSHDADFCLFIGVALRLLRTR
jgi:hypothetical protein